MIHFIPSVFLEDREPISVCLIGAGGTGSQVLPQLARIDTALRALGKQGLRVSVYDGDQVSEANLARQLFSPPDIGANKAIVQVSRLNRFYGFSYQAYPTHFTAATAPDTSYNIYLTCVDSVQARKDIYRIIKQRAKQDDEYNHRPSQYAYYWLDTGNMEDYGQVVLSTLRLIGQPESRYNTTGQLPSVLDMFPAMDDQAVSTPSCSLAAAIGQQDLFINTTVAVQAAALLWQMLRKGYLTQQGSFTNLQTGKTNPIPVRRHLVQRPICDSQGQVNLPFGGAVLAS